MKNKKLTLNEEIVVSAILAEVIRCMRWDDCLERYSDGGDFLMSLDKQELRSLKSAYKKLY